MKLPEHPVVDVERAEQIWAEYQRTHDLSADKDRVAAVEPVSGRVWIADSGIDLVHLKEAEGISEPVYLIRVGYDYYVRKGRR